MKDNIEQQIMDAKQCMGCMHQGLIVTSLDGTILETSPAAESILEAPPLSLKGRQFRDFCGVLDAYDEFLRQTDPEGRRLNKPVLVLAGGKRKIVNMSVQRAGKGQRTRYVHVFQDCADLRTMEERLVQSERLATIGRFGSQMAHEIRNPLNSISLNVELLEDELKESGEEARSLIRSVLKELDRLNDIVGEYLQFSIFPKPHLKRGHVDDVIWEFVQSFKAAPPSVKIEMSLMESSPEVWLDEPLLRQALENLVHNGTEAIDGEGVVRIETEVADHFLVIRVKDTGRGIAPEIRSRLFEPFFTTKAQGTGLGLATSQQITFDHNGHLVVESQAGKGSTFSILLPL